MTDRTCTLPDCDRKYSAKGLCKLHYMRQFKTGSTELGFKKRPVPPPCSIAGCQRKHCANGLCRFHYQRKYATGSTELIPREKLPPKLCTVDGCDAEMMARGLCTKHYQRMVNRGTVDDPIREATEGCSIPDCSGAHVARGWCVPHYNKWNRYGDPLATRKPPEHTLPCTIDGCDRRRRKQGLCELHARRQAKGSELLAPKRTPKVGCDEPECQRPHASRGLCRVHYARKYLAENRRVLSIKSREKYLSIPEDERRRQRAEYYLENRERIRAAAQKRYRELYPNDPTKWRAAKSRRKMRLAAKMTAEERHISEDYRRVIADDPCWYCGDTDAAHVDHFYPLAKGGTDHWWNLRRACVSCNTSKNARCGTWFILRKGMHSGAVGSVPAVTEASASDRRIAASPRVDTFRRGKVREDDRQFSLFPDYDSWGAA